MAFLALTTGYTCSPTSSLCSFSAYVFPFATGCPVSHVSHQLNCSVLTIRFPTLSTGYMFPMLAISYMFPGIMLWPMNGIFHKFWPKLLTLYRVDHYFFKGGGGGRGVGWGNFPKEFLHRKYSWKIEQEISTIRSCVSLQKIIVQVFAHQTKSCKTYRWEKNYASENCTTPFPQKMVCA